MGLIHKAESRQIPVDCTENSVDKKKTGLLGKINQSSGIDSLYGSFLSFVSGIQAERACVLYPSESRQYVCILNTGFDHTTVHRICPDIMSFDGKFPDGGKWYTFADAANLETFRSFFSSREFDSLTELQIHPVSLNDVQIYIVVAESKLNIIRERPILSESVKFGEFVRSLNLWQSMLPALTRIGSLRISDDMMRQRAKSALGSGKVSTLVKISFGELFNNPDAVYMDTDTEMIFSAMYHRIAQQTGNANLVTSQSDMTLRVALFASMPVDSGMYFTQLMKPMDKMFGAWRMVRVKVDPVCTTSSLTTILAFLHGEN
jgi:hypothetical protein